MKKHWKFLDWVMFVAEIALPIIAILCAIFIKQENYSTDAKLATIVAGVVGQLVLVGVQIKQVSIDVQANKERIDSVEKSVCFTNEMATILSSGEERRIAYIRRRLKELEGIFKVAAHEQETKLLSVSTYYDELKYLKQQLDEDPKKSKCEIWAMTGFSDNEWDDKKNDLEASWCEELKKLAVSITTRRVCIISPKLLSLFSKNIEFYMAQANDWKEHKENEEQITEKGLKSFIDYLQDYYSKDDRKYKVSSYSLRDDSQQYHELVNAKGFFGIKLSNGEMFIIKGEAVDAHTGLQGQYVFDKEVIKMLYDTHKMACENLLDLSTFILKNSSQAFIDFCKTYGIQMGK